MADMFKYRSVVDCTVVFSLEPLDGVFLGNSVFGSNGGFASSSQPHSASGSLEDDVEVHAEDTSEGVVLHSQIDVLLDAEAEAT